MIFIPFKLFQFLTCLLDISCHQNLKDSTHVNIPKYLRLNGPTRQQPTQIASREFCIGFNTKVGVIFSDIDKFQTLLWMCYSLVVCFSRGPVPYLLLCYAL